MDFLGPERFAACFTRHSRLGLVEKEEVAVIVDPLAVGPSVRSRKPRQLGEPIVQPLDLSDPGGISFRKMLQLDLCQDGGHRVDTQLGPQPRRVLAIRAVFRAALVCIPMPVGRRPLVVQPVLVHPDAGFDGRQRLARLQADARHTAPGAHVPALERGAVRMAGVFHDFQPVLLGKVADVIHVARQTEPMNGHNGPGVLGQSPFAVLHVDVERSRVDVDPHGNQPEEPHRHHRPPGAVVGHQDLATGRQIQREQHRRQRASAAGVGFAVGGLGEFRPRLLEFHDGSIGPEEIIGVSQVLHDFLFLLLAEDRPAPEGVQRRRDRLWPAVDRQSLLFGRGCGLLRAGQRGCACQVEAGGRTASRLEKLPPSRKRLRIVRLPLHGKSLPNVNVHGIIVLQSPLPFPPCLTAPGLPPRRSRDATALPARARAAPCRRGPTACGTRDPCHTEA